MANSVALAHTHFIGRFYIDEKTFMVVNEEKFQVGTVKSRILIADPDPDVSHTLQLYFQSHGHEVQLIDKAADVVKTARQWQPNAILISTEVTDRNPYQVCQEVIEDTLTAHIPLIMLLHLDERPVRLAALEAGVDDIITKPIDVEELCLRVEAAIRLSTIRVQA